MGFIRRQLEDIVAEQEACVYDRHNKVWLVWNGNSTFQAVDLNGEVLALWCHGGEISADNPSGAMPAAAALEIMNQYAAHPMSEIDDDGNAEHYLRHHAADGETYKKYSRAS